MHSRKKESLQQSIRGSRSLDRFSAGRKDGQIEGLAGMFFIVFLGLLFCGVLQMERYRAAALYLEDALAASNLASAVVDVREYGISHNVLIARPEEAFRIFRWAVRENLNLNEVWEGQAGSLVQGPVRIVQYIVYNVKSDGVTVYRFDESGQMTQYQEVPGNVTAPNGSPVRNTSVYSEIAYEEEGLLGVAVRAHKGNLVDVSR